MSIEPTYSGEVQFRAPVHGGIYAIVNTVNGKRYVGSATNIRSRWHKHRTTLRQGTHHSVLLQRAWNKYGADSFTFVLLEAVADRRELIAAEQRFIDQYACHDPAKGYNVAPRAGSSLGVKHTEATCNKQRKRFANGGHPMKGRRHTDESRAKMSASRVGVKRGPRSDEFRQKMSEVSMGRVISAEQRAKIAATLRGRKLPPEVVAKVAAANRGCKRSEATKRLMSESMKLFRIRASLQRNLWVFYGT